MQEIRIGCRNTPLALWQAREVERHLQNQNFFTEIIATDQETENGMAYNDTDKTFLLQKLIEGLQDGEIDVAVVAMKDLPSTLPENTAIVACLKRDFTQDVLVRNPRNFDVPLRELKVATDDPRRRAFWLRAFPNAEFASINGNANTRLEKAENGDVDASILSLARLKRLNLNPEYEVLPFILPSPAQGIIAVLGNADNLEVGKVFEPMNDSGAAYCAFNERGFQSVFSEINGFALGAFSELKGRDFRFTGAVCSFDGKNILETDDIFKIDLNRNYGQEMAEQLLKNGGVELFENTILQ